MMRKKRKQKKRRKREERKTQPLSARVDFGLAVVAIAQEEWRAAVLPRLDRFETALLAAQRLLAGQLLAARMTDQAQTHRRVVAVRIVLGNMFRLRLYRVLGHAWWRWRTVAHTTQAWHRAAARMV